MSDYARWMKNSARAREMSVRFSLWCEALSLRESVDAAGLIDFVAMEARRDPHALSAYLGLADIPSVVERVGGAKMHAILDEAGREALAACQLILENPGPRRVKDEIGPPPDPEIERISLGHRKTAARGKRGLLLEKLLKDPDPVVVAEALRNPRLREREVLDIAARRPAPESLFRNLARSERWIASLPVRVTIVMNPYSPPGLSILLLVTLPEQALKEAAKSERLHRAVRDGALEILMW